jgi:hypothetical protein
MRAINVAANGDTEDKVDQNEFLMIDLCIDQFGNQ